MIFLETERLVLRNVKAEDAAVIYDYRNNEACAKYQRGQTKEFDGIVALIEKSRDDVMGVDAPFLVAVALKETDEMVGEIVVMPEEGTISLGYTFSPTATTERAMRMRVCPPLSPCSTRVTRSGTSSVSRSGRTWQASICS